MAEYIDKEALRKVLENWRDAHADVDDEQGCGLLEDVIWEVDAQPAADVVEVVRCKDCIHCGFCGDATNLQVMGFYGFCSRGERKDGGDDCV